MTPHDWLQVSGVVETTSRTPVPGCQVVLEVLRGDVLIHEIAVFSDDTGHWQHLLQDGAEYLLIARAQPGRSNGQLRVAVAGQPVDQLRLIVNE